LFLLLLWLLLSSLLLSPDQMFRGPGLDWLSPAA